MAGPLDHQYNLGLESVYGTGVTPTRTYEWDISNSKHQWDPKPIQGSGMQVGDGAFERADRMVIVIGQGSGTVGLDVQTKGMGLLINGLCDTGVATLVGGTTYQHLFTSAMTDGLLPSQTHQYGVVRSDASGTVDVYTYLGVTFGKLEMKCDAGGVMTMTTDWDAKARTEGTALATASYPAGLLAPFHYGQIACTIGGSLTVPTTTALAVTGTVVSDVKSFDWNLDNKIDDARWVFGSRNQPRVAKRTSTVKLSTEYNAITYDSALSANTTLPVTITATSDQALSTGFATIQLVFPACKITSTDRPNPSADTPTIDYEFSIKKPTSGAAFYIVTRTSDAAL